MMKLDEIIKTFKRYKSAYKNYINVMWFMKRKKYESINIVLRNGTSYQLSRDEVNYCSFIFSEGSGIAKKTSIETVLSWFKRDEFPYREKIITVHGIHDGPYRFNFFFKDYEFLNVMNKVVIDVGAYVGDSAIYFALNGAKKVIALELYPYAYELAVKNIYENGLSEKIFLLNAGYGKDGQILVDEDLATDETTSVSTSLMSNGTKRKCEVYSLNSLLETFNINNAVLKMDCEGCEYNMIDEDSITLGKFSRIVMEYHYGYKKLVEKLRSAGFDVKYTRPKNGPSPQLTELKTEIGYIYATKR